LNDQILASAAQTAGMAPARGMATGGIVALQSGGSLSVAELQQRLNQARQNHQAALQYERMFSAATKRSDSAAYRQAQEKVAQTQAALDAAMQALLMGQSAASMPRAAGRTPDPTTARFAAEMQAPSAAAAPRIPGSSIVGKTGDPDKDIGPAEPPRLPITREIRSAGSGTPSPAAREQQPAANNLIDQAFAAVTQAYAPPTVPPELLAQRKRVADLQDLYTQQVLQDASLMRGEADKEIARREARANQPFFESAERPALLASYINPKKGQFFGSLAKGIAAIDIEEEKARKELAQYRATEADKVRQLNNTYRQLQLENAKYQEALLSGNMKTARESAEKIAQLRYNAAVKTEELKNDRTRADAALADARAKGISAGAQAAAVPGRQALAEAGLLEKRMKSQEGIQYAQLAAAKARLMENPLADKTAIANIDAELTRLQRLMDVKYGGIGAAAPSAEGATDLDAAAARVMERQ
jgi:hypothetical protein